jgi:hypothetical protein
MWTCSGMVGTASVERLLELASEAMRAEPTVLRADARFYDKLAVEQAKESAERTKCYSGRGRRPRRSFKLP